MLVHWIWLATRNLTDWAKVQLLQRFEDPEDIFRASREELSSWEELTPDWLKSLEDRELDAAQAILDRCMDKGIHLLPLCDAAYPARLKNISDPPVLLYYKGRLPDLDSRPVIGVVGTRKASAYGMQAAHRLGSQIGGCGGIVVSGLALGIDSMAMTGALTSGETVVGVLGCGIDLIYPRSNRALFQDTERYGCIISEYPPGTPAAKWTFPRRNRIISGLSCGVLVVEAPAKSGALITARLALEQGRDVFVVPGNIGVAACEGSNHLLREGAIPVECGWDVVGEYERWYPDRIRREPDPKNSREITAKTGADAPKEIAPENGSDKKGIDKEPSSLYSDVNDILIKLSEEERSLVSALTDGGMLVDDLIDKSGMAAGKALSLLTVLELKQVVVRHSGRRISLKI